MPKIISRLNKNRFVVPLDIQRLIENENKIIGDKKNTEHVKEALIDTGATSSVISNKIVGKLGLKPVGKQFVSTASSNNELVNIYEVLFIFPTDMVKIGTQPVDGKDYASGVRVFSQPTSFVSQIVRVAGNDHIHEQGISVLIGMDAINSSHLTICEGSLIMSF